MAANATTAGNAKKLVQLQSILSQSLAESLHRGFFGAVTIELRVQDGTIQHIRRIVEQIDR